MAKRNKEQWIRWILNSVALNEVKEMRENGWAEERIRQALNAIEEDGYGEGVEGE